MIVAGLNNSMKSLMIVWLTSGAAHVVSVVLPAATAALRYRLTSGVESAHRRAYSAASYVLPLQTSIAQAARTNAVPFGTFGWTVISGVAFVVVVVTTTGT